ncbi:nucleoside-diphosphate sugar epimerase [candidate division MSBL1 archaeon SCGC-AAA382C18]|uniref:Nucleoside-diphosphate sugar epimerase n=1 Tax=candidate division MSBL1 archaeon SCGC-AAA382C18 TaxID=1698281 RepID=A0A133VLE9_9EURY|nr:nucleoside-diphosphate sugar epimerase [candidate division MSBL1 archaeon SCGC-AAA382C18]
MSNVLVTGGAGFIGSNIVEALVDRGDDVTVLDNFHTGTRENLEKVIDEIELVEAPCKKIPDYDFGDLDKIFHIGIPSSSPMYRENHLLVGEAINEFIKVLELAREKDAKMVYASSSSMYGRCEPPHSEDMEVAAFDYYTEARLAMERIAKVHNEFYNVESIGLRFFSVYGPHEQAKGKYANIITQFYWKMKKDEKSLIFGDGTQTRDFTHVSDIVQAALKAADSNHEYEIINVGTGKETTFNKVVEMLNEKLDKSIKPEYQENPIKNYIERTHADISKAKKLLDYKPTISLEEGIEQMIQREN